MAVNERNEDAPTPEDTRIAALYRQAVREEPPAHLDRAVREVARIAVVGTAASRPTPWWNLWRMPFAAAAVVVVSASVVVLMLEEGAHQVGETPTDVPSPAPAVPAEPVPQKEQPLADRAADAASVPPSAARAKSDSPAGQARADSERADERAREAAEIGGRRSAREEAPAAASRSGAATGTARPSPPPAGPGGLSAAPAQDAAARDPQPFPAEKPTARPKVDSTIGIRGLEMEQQTHAVPSVPPEPSAPMPTAKPQAAPVPPPVQYDVRPAAPPPSALPAAKPAPSVSAKPAPSIMAKPPPAPRAAAPAETQRMERAQAGAASSIAPLVSELEGRPARQWLDRIYGLRREGRRTEADALLAEFKRRFPDEWVPPELQQP